MLLQPVQICGQSSLLCFPASMPRPICMVGLLGEGVLATSTASHRRPRASSAYLISSFYCPVSRSVCLWLFIGGVWLVGDGVAVSGPLLHDTSWRGSAQRLTSRRAGQSRGKHANIFFICSPAVCRRVRRMCWEEVNVVCF